jgi:hypothetical protein
MPKRMRFAVGSANRLFLDFDPADGIPAGVDWEQRLYQELRRCQALLIVLTPAWLESKWCGNELLSLLNPDVAESSQAFLDA